MLAVAAQHPVPDVERRRPTSSCRSPAPQRRRSGFDDLGYRYEFDAFAPADHFTLAVNDQYAPAADFLGDARVDRNPAHVTYVRNPKMDFAGVGTVADHAYWLSGIELRERRRRRRRSARSTCAPRASASATPSRRRRPNGARHADRRQRLRRRSRFTSQRRRGARRRATPKRNRLMIDARNISHGHDRPASGRSVTCDAAARRDHRLAARVHARRLRQGQPQLRRLARPAARRGCRARASRAAALKGSRAAASPRAAARSASAARGKRKRGHGRRASQVAIARKAGKQLPVPERRAASSARPRSCTQIDWVTRQARPQEGQQVPVDVPHRRKLPRGTYDLRVRAIDGTGTVEKQPRKQSRKTSGPLIRARRRLIA